MEIGATNSRLCEKVGCVAKMGVVSAEKAVLQEGRATQYSGLAAPWYCSTMVLFCYLTVGPWYYSTLVYSKHLGLEADFWVVWGRSPQYSGVLEGRTHGAAMSSATDITERFRPCKATQEVP